MAINLQKYKQEHELSEKIKHQSVDYTTMKVRDFVKVTPIHCQRKTLFRLKKTAKLLFKNPVPCHKDVALVKYPQKNGEVILRTINGMTRGDIWALGMGLETMTGIDDAEQLTSKLVEMCKKVESPDEVRCTVYHVGSEEEAEQLYYAHDSSDSVEKSTDKITGYCRQLGIDFENLSILQRGGFQKALEFASYHHPQNGSVLENILLFRKELEKLDQVSTTSNPKVYNANTLCAALMMLKKYGINDKRVIRILRRLEDSDFGMCSAKKGTEGLTFLLREMDRKLYFPKGWGTSGADFPVQQDFILYCMEKAYKKENIKLFSKPGAKRKDVYKTFWDDVE